MKVTAGGKDTVGDMQRVVQSIPSSYTVWKDGTQAIAESNIKGGTDYTTGTDTVVIQNALDGVGDGGIVQLRGPLSLGQITIPNKAITLIGEGKEATVITYTGAGTFLLSSNQAQTRSSFGLKNLKVTTTTGLIGFDMKGFWYSQVDNVYFNGFSTEGIRLDGTTVGCYFNDVTNNIIYGRGNSAVGLRFMGGGGHAANKNYVYKNRFEQCNIGIKGDTGANIVQGNTLLDNDVEELAGATPICIKYEGDNSILMGNWLESTVAATTGIYLRGSGNSLFNNKYVLVGGGSTNLNRLSGASHDLYEPNIGVYDCQYGFLTVNLTVLNGNTFADYDISAWTGGLWTPIYVNITPMSDMAGKYFWVATDANKIRVNISAAAGADYVFTIMAKSNPS